MHNDNWHALNADAALTGQGSTSAGLNATEAAQRLAAHGPNRLTPPKKRGPFLRFLLQFHNVLIYVLLGAAVVTALLGHGVDTAVILGVVIINALDLMYLWMYKPRARKALQQIVLGMSNEEWLIFYRSQLLLKRDREISQVFVDGLVGRNFAKALSFYLDQADAYLVDMMEMGMFRARMLKKQGIPAVA